MTVQTHPQTAHDLRQAAINGLRSVRGTGWLAGFGNMLGKELGEWFHTSRWLKHLLLWPFIVNGYVAFMVFLLPGMAAGMPQFEATLKSMLMGFPLETLGFLQYFTIAILAGIVGAVILAQDEIIQEKQMGTAAWILSKPAARSAFIVSKLLANAVGMLVFIIAIPGFITLVENYLAFGWIPSPLPLLAATGVLMLGLIFYMCLVIMLGVLYESRGPVLGFAFGVIFAGMVFSSFIPPLIYVLPAKLDGIAAMVMMGVPLPDIFVLEIISTAALSILFTLIALWRFHRKEF